MFSLHILKGCYTSGVMKCFYIQHVKKGRFVNLDKCLLKSAVFYSLVHIETRVVGLPHCWSAHRGRGLCCRSSLTVFSHFCPFLYIHGTELSSGPLFVLLARN